MLHFIQLPDSLVFPESRTGMGITWKKFTDTRYLIKMKLKVLLTVIADVIASFGYCQTSFNNMETLSPADGHRFGTSGSRTVSWKTSAQLMQLGVSVKYVVKFVEVKDGQTREEAMAGNDVLFSRELIVPAENTNGSQFQSLSSQPIERQIVVAWQVKAEAIDENDIVYNDASNISTFETPFLVDYFYAKNALISVTDANKDLTNFSGSGAWKLNYYDAAGVLITDSVKVSFSNLRLHKGSVEYFLDSGQFQTTLPNPVSIPFAFDGVSSDLVFDKAMLGTEGPIVKPAFEVILPIGQQQVLLTADGENSEIALNNSLLFGAVPVVEKVVNVEPGGFSMIVYHETQLYVSQQSSGNGNAYWFQMKAGFNFPETVYSLNSEPYFFFSEGVVRTAADLESIRYKTSVLQKGPFELTPGSGLAIYPTTGITDFSAVSSPSGEEPSWKGVKMSAIQLNYPDTLGNFVFTKTPGAIAISQDLNYVITSLGQTTAFSHEFPSTENKAVSAGDSVTLSSGHYEIENNVIKSAYVEGTIKQAFFNPDETYPFRYYLTDQGWKASFTIDNIEFINQTPHLVAPTQLLAHSALLDWPDVAGATSYIVSVSKDYFQTTLANYAAVEVAESSLNVVGLSAETEYQYAVKPIIGETTTSFSYPFVFSTPIDAPGAPENFAVMREDTKVAMSWKDNPDEDGYVIERMAEDGETFIFADSVAQNATSYAEEFDPSLDRIAYRIAAYNVGGLSDYSQVASFWTSVPQEDASLLGISLFPNPASETVKVTAEKPIQSIRITNLNGQAVYRIDLEQPKTVFELDVQGFRQGLLIVTIQLENGTVGSSRLFRE
jgi:hypothetical protein